MHIIPILPVGGKKMADDTSNRFGLLAKNNTSDNDDDTEVSFKECVSKAVTAVLESEKQTQKLNRDDRNLSTLNLDGAKMTTLIEQVVLAIQRLLIKTVTAAVTTAVAEVSRQLLQLRHTDNNERRKEFNRMKAEVQCNRFEIDRLEQYSRKENVRIHDLTETQNEDTTDIIVKTAAKRILVRAIDCRSETHPGRRLS